MSGFDTTSISRILTRHGVTLAWVIAGLCLLLVLISIGWQIRSDLLAKKRDYAPQQAQTIVAREGPSYKINDVVRANLLGDPTPAPVVKEAPKTTLDLTLQGVLWATNDGLARAIIKSGRGKSKLYSVGEKIAGASASLKEVRNNEVIISRGGAAESLPLVTVKGGDNIISYTSGQSNDLSQASFTPRTSQPTNSDFSQPDNTNQVRERQARKVRKPNFSGLDRALEKLGEI